MVNVRNILIVGRIGSGKSTLANVLSKVDEFDMTSKAKAKTFKYKGINYQIIDTVGLGGTKLKKKEFLEKFAKDTDDYIGKGILQILLVMDGRLTEDVLTDYLWLSSFFFDKRVFDHTTIVRTNFGKFENEESCKKVTEELVKLNEEINREVNREINEKVISKGRIVYVNNPEINDEESDEELVKSNEKLRRKSREILLDYLGTLDSEDYEPMNGEKLERKFNQLKTNLDEWINQLSEKNKTLLGNFIERHQEKWAESLASEDYSELKKDLKECREILKRDSLLNERQVDELLDKLKKLVKLNKEIEAGNWVNKTIEEEKKILDELHINCETDAKGVVDVKRKNSIRELLERQEKFTREEQGKKSNTLQEQLNKAKRNLRGLFLSEEKIKSLLEQKKQIVELEILAKTPKENKRLEIQQKIPSLLTNEAAIDWW